MFEDGNIAGFKMTNAYEVSLLLPQRLRNNFLINLDLLIKKYKVNKYNCYSVYNRSRINHWNQKGLNFIDYCNLLEPLSCTLLSFPMWPFGLKSADNNNNSHNIIADADIPLGQATFLL